MSLLDAREALRTLKEELERLDNTVGNQLAQAAEKDREIEKLCRRLELAEATNAALESERERLVKRGQELDRDLTSIKDALSEKVAALKLRTEDAEQRAKLHETRSREMQEKAERHDRIAPACQKLLDTLSALPLDMADAGIIPGASRPKIELYGTYDWQNVMDAKFALMQAMRKEE